MGRHLWRRVLAHWPPQWARQGSPAELEAWEYSGRHCLAADRRQSLCLEAAALVQSVPLAAMASDFYIERARQQALR